MELLGPIDASDSHISLSRETSSHNLLSQHLPRPRKGLLNRLLPNQGILHLIAMSLQLEDEACLIYESYIPILSIVGENIAY